MIELSLLKVLSKKANFEGYKHLINTKFLSKQSLVLLKHYTSWFSSSDQDIDFGEFKSRFFLGNGNLDDKSVEEYTTIIQSIDYTKDRDCLEVIKAFEQSEFYNNIQQDIQKNVDFDTFLTKVNTFSDKILSINDDQNLFLKDMDLGAVLEATDRSKSILQWRLESLRELFGGGLIKSDFGIVAAYSDMGKTSFLASEVSYMASQLNGDEWIAWFNTEGDWTKIMNRIFLATLNCTPIDLQKFEDSAKRKYIEIMNGNINRIRILDFQRKNIKDVENGIKNNKSSLVIFDLLDHIRGFENYIGKDGGLTGKYGELYQWARELATTYCPVLATSQLNGDGNNELYPSMVNLKGSRVDKQAAATFQLVIGGMEGNSNERFLSMPKNKINSNKGWRKAVSFDSLRCRFHD